MEEQISRMSFLEDGGFFSDTSSTGVCAGTSLLLIKVKILKHFYSEDS